MANMVKPFGISILYKYIIKQGYSANEADDTTLFGCSKEDIEI